jgi:hypothetical protein
MVGLANQFSIGIKFKVKIFTYKKPQELGGGIKRIREI